MSTDMNPTDRKACVHVTPSGEKALKIYEKEIATYLRELPRLVDEGEDGRFAVVKGDEIVSIWDTDSDAIQAGSEKFGLAPIFIKKIDERDIKRFAMLNGKS